MLDLLSNAAARQVATPVFSTSRHWTVRIARWAEMLAVFFIGPVVGSALFVPKHVLVVLAVLALIALTLLWIDSSFDRRQLWNFSVGRLALRAILIRWAILIAALTPLVWFFLPERFLSFPRERPTLWIIVMAFYPIFSVYAQELVWRVFVHHRYAWLFPGPRSLLAASALAFGVMHTVFQNWIAVALCIVGGVIFAHTYERTRSAAAVWIEHALYGCAVFTIGLGVYFYGGVVR